MRSTSRSLKLASNSSTVLVSTGIDRVLADSELFVLTWSGLLLLLQAATKLMNKRQTSAGFEAGIEEVTFAVLAVRDGQTLTRCTIDLCRRKRTKRDRR